MTQEAKEQEAKEQEAKESQFAQVEMTIPMGPRGRKLVFEGKDISEFINGVDFHAEAGGPSTLNVSFLCDKLVRAVTKVTVTQEQYDGLKLFLEKALIENTDLIGDLTKEVGPLVKDDELYCFTCGVISLKTQYKITPNPNIVKCPNCDCSRIIEDSEITKPEVSPEINPPTPPND